jgi:hypothetical protein
LQAIQYSLFVKSREVGTSRWGLSLQFPQCEPRLCGFSKTEQQTLFRKWILQLKCFEIKLTLAINSLKNIVHFSFYFNLKIVRYFCRTLSMYCLLWVCDCSLSYPVCKAHSQYFHLWLVWLHYTFPHYLKNSSIFETRWLNIQCVSEAALGLRGA